jgi:hypothetical protein
MIWHVKRVDELSRENEKLRAQVGMMKKTLIKASCYLIDLPDDSLSKEIEELILDNIIQDYHNPADVEALRKAREALFDYKTFLESFQCGCEPSDETCPGVYCERCCRLNQANETLDEVDKAIGGKTDV